MNGSRLKIVLAISALLLIAGSAAIGQTAVRPNRIDREWRLSQKATLEDLGPRALQRSADATDRAMGYLDLSRLKVRTYNFGLTLGRIFSSGRANYANTDGRQRSYIFVSAPAFAVGAGPWHPNAMVHESSDFHSLTKIDWEARDGARGELFRTGMWGYPQMATTDYLATWPVRGWPAPEEVMEVWYGTDIWNKWRRTADRECYCIFDDSYADREGDGQSVPLGIEVQFRGLNFEYHNAVFVQYEFTNHSSHTLTDVYLGQLVDAGSPTTNSFAGFPRYDRQRQLIYGVGAGYDSLTGTHPVSPGGSEQAAWVGTMWLETPTGSFKTSFDGALEDDPSDILTRVAFLDWGDRVLYSEESLYGAMSGDITLMESNDTEHIWKVSASGGSPVLIQDETDYITYNSTWAIAADNYYYASSGPVTMYPGESLDYVIAFVGGLTEQELLEAADTAVQLYRLQYLAQKFPSPPHDFRAGGHLAGPHGREYDPRIHAHQIHYAPPGEITLMWDGRLTETFIDLNWGFADFEGYRLYRSIDRGLTWGEPLTDAQGAPVGWIPYRQWDLRNGITGTEPLSHTWLGDDTGIVRRFTDPAVRDGVEYWYALTAYDRGGTFRPGYDVPSLESPIGGNPNHPQVVAAVAGSRPPGYSPGSLPGSGNGTDMVLFDETDRGGISIGIRIVDESMVTGSDYTVEVTDHYRYSTGESGYREETGYLFGGISLRDDSYGYTRLDGYRHQLEEQEVIETPVVDGFVIEVREPNRGAGGIMEIDQLIDTVPGLTLVPEIEEAYLEGEGAAFNRANLSGFMSDVTILFEGFVSASGDTNLAHDAVTRGAVRVPFVLRDSDTGTRLYPVIVDRGVPGPDYLPSNNPGEWDGRDDIIVTDVPYFSSGSTVTDFTSLHPASADSYWTYDPADPACRSDWIYRIGFRDDDQDHDLWDESDQWLVRVFKPLIYYAGTDYTFSTTAPGIVDSVVTLDEIRVVPNPYYIYADWDQGDYRRKIQFTNVPFNSTITIFTLSGEMVAELDHHGSATAVAGGRGYNSDRIGTVDWNLWSYEFTEVSYGIYLYIVKTDSGRKKVGKFAIIR